MPLWSDEAYYRLWSHRLDAGYFDHPPMIAWFVWAGVHVVGDNALGARLASLAACAVTTWLVFDTARLLELPRATAMRATIWFNATLLIGVEGWIALPDAPLTLFWAGSLWAAMKALRGSGAWWLVCGLAAGLACLSKYSGLFLAPGLLAWLAVSDRGRAALRTPWPYLAAALAIAVFGVNIAWNASHGWVTFNKQFGRTSFGSFKPIMALAMVGTQAAFLTPAIFLFAARSLALAGPRRLTIATAPFLAYMAFHSLHGWVQGQWLQPLYPTWAICAAAAADQLAPGRRWLEWLRQVAAPGGFLLSAVALGLLLNPFSSPAWLPDPFANLKGWPGFARQLETVRQRDGAGWVGAATYGLVAHLRTRPELKAPVIQILERARYGAGADDQRPDFTQPGLVLDVPRHLEAVPLQACFALVRPLPPLAQASGASQTIYQVFEVAHPRRPVLQAGC